MIMNAPLNSPLAPGSLSTAPPAELHLLTLQSVTPRSRTAFCEATDEGMGTAL